MGIAVSLRQELRSNSIMAGKSNRRNIQNKRLILFIKQKHLESTYRQGKSQQRNRLHILCVRTYQLWNTS